MGLTDTDKLIESLTRKSVKEEILGFHESASLINNIIDEVKNIPTYDIEDVYNKAIDDFAACLLYTSPSPRDPKTSRMPSSA